MSEYELYGLSSARDWNRTSTFLRTADFESAASTNSATRAFFSHLVNSHSAVKEENPLLTYLIRLQY